MPTHESHQPTTSPIHTQAHTSTPHPTLNVSSTKSQHPPTPLAHASPQSNIPLCTGPTNSSAKPISTAEKLVTQTTIPADNQPQTISSHPMVIRVKAGIFKPLERMNYHVTTTSQLPRSHVHALWDSNWKEAMLDEYNALITNGTWVLVPRPANVNVVRSMWLFKHNVTPLN
ncbi:ribonuclease H-like domain-containing protein [Tanacetum coccineum]|uniref:Ribonuclease H-like domain-containing protein n=1 Tax=Tanacetum coccineum TaxID=301880 RepID=A0ABQ4WX19_9ASTR